MDADEHTAKFKVQADALLDDYSKRTVQSFGEQIKKIETEETLRDFYNLNYSDLVALRCAKILMWQADERTLRAILKALIAADLHCAALEAACSARIAVLSAGIVAENEEGSVH